jgi:hypothetical protein
VGEGEDLVLGVARLREPPIDVQRKLSAVVGAKREWTTR